MKTSSLLTIGLTFSTILTLTGQVKPQPAPEKSATDEYYGIRLEDPYRNLENLDDPKVIEWMKSNAGYARAKIDEVAERKNIIKKLEEFDKRKESTVFNLQITKNDNYFYLKRKANEENGKLYHRLGYKGTEKLLFDPDTYKKNTKVNYSISSISPNEAGNKVAIEIAPNGSESAEVLILDLNGKISPEIIDRCWFASASWMPDGKSFTYNRLSSADVTDTNRLLNSKVYYHKVGDDPKNDREFFCSSTNPELKISKEEFPINYFHQNSKTHYGLVVTVDKRLKLYTTEYKEEVRPTTWKKLVEKEDEVTNFGIDKDFLYYQTFKNAPHFKIIKVPVKSPDISKAVTVVEEPESGIISEFAVTKDGLYYTVLENGVQTRVYFLPKGKTVASELKLPFTAGSASLSTKDETLSDVWITLSGWTSPSKRFMYNPTDNSFTLQPLSKLVDYPELKNIVAREVMVPSHDGVMVPVSIIHDKNVKLNSNNPVLIMGYGSYGMSITPFFSTILLTYCSYGGVFVIPHVRGGGELGDAWHKAGHKSTKPNTWKDLIASAEYLVNQKYTSPQKIAIMGGSAGGILVGRSMTERPDLFAAVISEVGAMNTVRMENTPNGPGNVPEFGTVKNEAEFKALLEMDSYHHLKKGVAYPATLLTAGINDPRVIAWEPAKFAARLQTSTSSEKPVLFLTDFEAGHGMGDSKTKTFESFADTFSFAYQHTGHPKFQPSKKLEKY
ncbi:hypothetical protein FLJC2902T_14140 [Flavobacterium limnosediminis JC2902]|uniref:prolyl oligopeptidase n=1 Tax=Flavobacterium limnosediminis JC2902 TaxID=1341181 RepID=V6SRK7_9FLAO|nr:prolyl oligopeptidase family serine peptidase [Flavobacterium limnosediminis]ESU28817.1 hypothetical protein FLJC2902T_14140 [Flavobacterium limnosediminis JC2902]